MIVFFGGLAEKMLGQLRESVRREVGRDRDVLQGRAKLVADLLVNCIDDFLTCKHRTVPPAGFVWPLELTVISKDYHAVAGTASTCSLPIPNSFANRRERHKKKIAG